MSEFDLVEEHPKEVGFSQFERIVLAAKRAKDIHNLNRTSLVDTHHKAAYTALLELQQGMITPVYREEVPEEELETAQELEDSPDETEST